MRYMTWRGTLVASMEFKAKEEWSLSDGGKVLTVTTTYSGQQANRIAKQVYNRQ
jgi:hypothetical protein